MKISPVNTSTARFNKNNVAKKQNSIVNSNAICELNSYPSNYYLNFCGGKSLDLAKTYEQLQKYAKIPQGVEKLIQKVLPDSSCSDISLVDLHKSKYVDLLYCTSLDEAKYFFPEFSYVLSDRDVCYNANSFLDRFFRGEFFIEGTKKSLNPKEDLSLQLLQQYWAECKSIQDLDEIYGTSLHPIMKKLNIPFMERNYAHYLALSDKEKNSKITKLISDSNTGRVLTEKTRSKISESLKEYYEKNPGIVYSRTKSDEKVLNDPIKKAMFSEVLLRAWGYHESNSIKKAMSRFMKKKDISASEFTKMVEEIDNPKSPMREFWEKNQWAKDKFSKCMEKSWERQKELEDLGLVTEPKLMLHYVPSQLLEKFKMASPEIGEKVFNREFYCVYDKDPVYLDDMQYFKNKTEFIAHKIFKEDTNTFQKWDLALSQALAMLFNDVAKTKNEGAVEYAKLILKYASESDFKTFDLFKAVATLDGISNTQKKKFETYLDLAWDRADNDRMDEINTVLNDMNANLVKMLGRDVVEKNKKTIFFNKLIARK